MKLSTDTSIFSYSVYKINHSDISPAIWLT